MATRVREVIREVQLVGNPTLDDLRWFMDQTKSLPGLTPVDLSLSSNQTTYKMFIRAAEPKDY